MKSLLLAFMLVFSLVACSPAVRQVASTTVVSSGAVLSELHRTHQQSYITATDNLRTSIRQRRGSLDDYDREVMPINAAFERRSQLIQTVDEHLYAAATIIDATRSGGDWTSYRPAASRVLRALRETLESLRRGDALPPVDIPEGVTQVIRTLELIAGGSSR